jgi:hypothetical protein
MYPHVTLYVTAIDRARAMLGRSKPTGGALLEQTEEVHGIHMIPFAQAASECYPQTLV